jgi:para-nitrobenzyl esterase
VSRREYVSLQQFNVMAHEQTLGELKGDRMKSALSFALILSVVSISSLTAQVVQTAQGKISGVKSLDSAVTVFKGVPFAAPPTGDLRWRAPQPPASWQGVRKTDEFGASCMQLKAGERLPWTREFMVQNSISDDCLYLNIWTPRTNASANLPVIVFIHGGGFSEGSGAIDVYRGGNLAAKGAVVVTVNYRLGAFGFLAHPELTAESGHHSSGNYGLLDLVAALKWVNANIANFGGDPQNVTIWGQSAGAFAVGDLVASPLTAGLFQHGQADSGLGISSLPTPSLKDAEQIGVKYADEHHAASIKELRAVPAEALLPNPNAARTPTSAPALAFSPIIDGWILPDTPQQYECERY